MRILVIFLLSASVVIAGPGLTIYNQNFAVVRDTVPLDLKAGVNEVVFDGATLHLEPDSVILRDPSGKPLQVLEQNYRNDPVTQGLLLSLFEGKEVDFVVREVQKPDRIIRGKIIRSGYAMHNAAAQRRYGQNYAARQVQYGGHDGSIYPIVEVEGKIQFTLPGQPIFPSLGDETILKPQISWKIYSKGDLKSNAELGYITNGLYWEASYNIVAPEKGDTLDIVGWVTMDNQCGRDFADAKIKLMAGDVSKLDPNRNETMSGMLRASKSMAYDASSPTVTEKTFDEYHLYSLERPTTLRDRETKQVEFIRAAGIKSKLVYVYDGMLVNWQNYRGTNPSYLRQNEEFGSESQPKIAVMREFKNTKENGLGIPLPKGRMRFYRTDGTSLEFTGENEIDHTPTDETVRVYTGNAFDLVGARKRTNFQVNTSEKWCLEAIEITLRNRKKEPATIRVVEHLYRWYSWEVFANTKNFEKVKSDEIVFEQTLDPGEEVKISYSVKYTW